MATIIDQQHAMVTNTAEPLAPAPGAEEPGAASLDKVRDILFGGQMRDLDRRFGRVEERLAKETSELREDLRKRLAALEQFARTETETLAERVKTEHDEKTEAILDLTRQLHETSSAFDKKISVLDDQLARAQRELRQQILEVHQRLADDMRDKIDAVLARLNQEAEDLRTDKADRSAIAGLFTEMAMRLTHTPSGVLQQE